MPFRKNHTLPEYGVDQCMNPQLANRTVLRCERPYYDPRGHASYRYDDQVGRSSEEDMGSGRSVAGSLRVKEKPTGWVSPFESWHGLRQQQTQPLGRSAGPLLPVQMQTHQSKFESESYSVEQRSSGPPRMQYQVQQPPAGYYQYSPPSHFSGTQAGDYQASATRSFDMQPMALTMPTVQQPEYQRPLTAHTPSYQSAPAVSGSLNTSVGARPGPGGQYYEEYAASTPSTTSSVPVYAPPPRPQSQSRVQSQPHSQGLFERRSYNNWHPSGSEQSNESPETRTDGSSPYARPGQGVTSPVGQDPNVSPSGYSMSGLADGSMGGPVQMSLGGRQSAGGSGSGGGESGGGSGGQDVASIQAGLAAEPPFPAISAAKTAGSTTTGVENGGGGDGSGAASAGKAVKKKAAKACLQCQRAHLTCDDSRPCTRCVKKGQGDQCCEGQRKKAKYLMTELELAEHNAKKRSRARKLPVDSATEESKKIIRKSTGESTPLTIVRKLPDQEDDIMAGGDVTLQQDESNNQELRDPNFGNELSFEQGFQFDSQAANLEYAVLDSIFADLPGLAEQNGVESFMNAWQGAAMGSQSMIGGNVTSQATLDSDMMDFAVDNGAASNSLPSMIPPQPDQVQDNAPGPSTGMGTMGIGSIATQASASSVYDLVSEPYDYTVSYHQLMRFLARNFDQKSILRVVKSLAAFRPSLIALQMPLSFEDEVFLEKSFQRTLIELEKLISYSGTPTAVWRRTGEICVVGDEFARLAGWNRADLLGTNGNKGKFIYELLDRSSTVDYFAKFSQHAFENTAQNFYMQVVLQNGSEQSNIAATAKEIRCAASFTIRRDVFDLPCAVIGQLLPITG